MIASHIPSRESMVPLIAWLVSADAVGVTGQSLDMNNGAWM